MRKPKVVISIVSVLSLLAGTLLFGLIIIHAATRTTPNPSIAKSDPTVTQYPHVEQVEIRTITQKVVMKITSQPALKGVPTLKPTTGAPTTIAPVTPTAAPVVTQPAPVPVQASSGPDRYYPVGTPAATMMANATNLTKQQVKLLIESQVNKNWAVIQSKLGFSTQAQAYAFFLGMASRESTLNAGLETGSGPSHSYGAIQASETAYSGTSYPLESDVPQMTIYAFTPENYYDPGIAIHMGIRHLLHFSNQARAAGYSGTNILRYALIGYNTGWVTNASAGLLQSYSDEIGALAGWYLTNGHLYDDQFTWTGSSAVNRSSPWGWA
jgi:hypothetical protein